VPRTDRVTTARRAAEWVSSAGPAGLDELAQRPSLVGEYARQALRISSRPDTASTGSVPDRLSATALVSWRRDPQQFITQALRPIPNPPSRAAEIGTTFHSWVEQHFGQASIDIEDGQQVQAIDKGTIERLQQTFIGSEFAIRHADHIEMSFELVLGRFRVPGKIDAVFITGDHAEVVDWKTSKMPDEKTLEVMKWQLALYRFAIQRVHPEITEVTGTFYFVGSDDIVRFTELPEETDIIAWLEANDGN
ncbi:MAG: PD-(D/E)XK nuclease family protein, partial [Brevibacterium sp.]|nr:PD-(D/E)XK nuclease family protein [Brevibacterium sp.]